MAMTFWGWEELPDDVLMKDQAYWKMLKWIEENEPFTRGQFIKASDEAVDGTMRLSDLGLFLKQLATGLIEKHKGHLSTDGNLYWIRSSFNLNSIIPAQAWDTYAELIDAETPMDAYLQEMNEEERIENREDAWNDLEELDYWQEV